MSYVGQKVKKMGFSDLVSGSVSLRENYLDFEKLAHVI